MCVFHLGGCLSDRDGFTESLSKWVNCYKTYFFNSSHWELFDLMFDF